MYGEMLYGANTEPDDLYNLGAFYETVSDTFFLPIYMLFFLLGGCALVHGEDRLSGSGRRAQSGRARALGLWGRDDPSSGDGVLFSFTAQTGRSAFQIFLCKENGSRSDMGSSCIPSDGALAAALPSLVLSGAGNE